jgi:hypothetical protein
MKHLATLYSTLYKKLTKARRLVWAMNPMECQLSEVGYKAMIESFEVLKNILHDKRCM